MATHSASVTALTVADRGLGSIRHISPNTSPGPSVPIVLAFALPPMLISTEPETIRNAVFPSSPSAIIVSPAPNFTVCIDVLEGSRQPIQGVGGMIGARGRYITSALVREELEAGPPASGRAVIARRLDQGLRKLAPIDTPSLAPE